MAGRRSIGIGLFTGQQPPGADRSPYRDAVELAAAAGEAGFDAFWVSEHHGLPDGHLPAPLLLLASLATATRRITLGSGVALAPLHHPLRVAEDAAVVDQLSNGRLLPGLGLGYAAHEYAAFGVNPAPPGGAALRSGAVPPAVLDRRGVRLGRTGLLRTAAARDAATRALRGHPGGGYAPAALRRARELADGHLIGPADPVILDELLPAWADPVSRPFTVAVNVLVLLTDDLADAAAARTGYAGAQATYEAMQSGGIAHAGLVAPDATHPVDAADVDRYMQAVGSLGTVVAACRGVLDRLPAWADQHLVLRVLFPEPDARRQVRRIERLGHEVLPRLR